MWMAYCTDIEIVDLESGVKHLRQQFNRWEFDAEHESVYGMGQFYSEEECLEIAENYAKGQEICTLFLDGIISIECFVEDIMELDLSDFLYRLKNYLPAHLLQELDFSASDSENEDN